MKTPWSHDGHNSVLDAEGRHVMATANVRREALDRIIVRVNAFGDLPDDVIKALAQTTCDDARTSIAFRRAEDSPKGDA